MKMPDMTDAEKDREIEQLEAENDNMRKIFDGLMAILPPENDETKDPAYATHVATHGAVWLKSRSSLPIHRCRSNVANVTR